MIKRTLLISSLFIPASMATSLSLPANSPKSALQELKNSIQNNKDQKGAAKEAKEQEAPSSRAVVTGRGLLEGPRFAEAYNPKTDSKKVNARSPHPEFPSPPAISRAPLALEHMDSGKNMAIYSAQLQNKRK
jgi:hypothetical protein